MSAEAPPAWGQQLLSLLQGVQQQQAQMQAQQTQLMQQHTQLLLQFESLRLSDRAATPPPLPSLPPPFPPPLALHRKATAGPYCYAMHP